MKQALDDSGKLITAGADSVSEARCPTCGALVFLRRRRTDGKGGATYFWRHQDHTKPGCPGRLAAIENETADASPVKQHG